MTNHIKNYVSQGFLSKFFFSLPETLLLLGLLFVFFIILLRWNKYTKVPFALFSKNIALSAAFINLSLIVVWLVFFLFNWEGSLPIYCSIKDVLVFDTFTTFFKVVIGQSSVLSLLLLKRWWNIKSDKGVIWESPLLILFGVLIMFLLTSSNNLLLTFFLVEGLSICLYFILAAEVKGNAFASVLVYYLLGAISSIFFAYGMLRVYWSVGSFNYKEIYACFQSMSEFKMIEESTNLSFMLGALMFSLLFKLAAFPSYFWLRSLYCTASTPIVCFFGLPVKVATFAAFFRLFCFAFAGLAPLWADLVLFSGIGSIVVGCVISLKAKWIHTFLAGSGINHMGYVLCGLGCQTHPSYAAAIFYLITYIITSAAFFVLLVKLKSVRGKPIIYVKDLYGVQDSLSIQAALIIIIFSFTGIPPFVGFYAKVSIIAALYTSGHIVLCGIIIITALISAYYYLRIISLAEFKKTGTRLMGGFFENRPNLKRILNDNNYSALKKLMVAVFKNPWSLKRVLNGVLNGYKNSLYCYYLFKNPRVLKRILNSYDYSALKKLIVVFFKNLLSLKRVLSDRSYFMLKNLISYLENNENIEDLFWIFVLLSYNCTFGFFYREFLSFCYGLQLAGQCPSTFANLVFF